MLTASLIDRVTGDEQFLKKHEKIESAFVNKILGLLESANKQKLKQLTKIIELQDLKSLNLQDFKAAIPVLSQAIKSLWLVGWREGNRDGQVKALFKTEIMGEATSEPLLNKRAEAAVNQRSNKIATELSSGVWEDIKKHLTSAIVPQPETGNPISRKELVKRLEATIKGTEARAKAIARTELTFAYNSGRVESYRNAGVKQVRFYAISDERTCPYCASRHETVANLDDGKAIAAIFPPIHVNCVVGDTSVSAQSVSGYSKRRYQGILVEITTSRGNKLTCTPNHPILTSAGWVPASRIAVGGDVFSSLDTERMTRADLHDNYVKTSIEKIVGALEQSDRMPSRPVPVSPEDFHCDGTNSKIAVIGSYSLLDVAGLSVPVSPATVADGAKSEISQPRIGAEFSKLNSQFNKPSLNGSIFDPEKLAQFCKALPVPVFRDEAIAVKFFHADTFVYNLETKDGFYYAENILTHNCRCVLSPITDSMPEIKDVRADTEKASMLSRPSSWAMLGVLTALLGFPMAAALGVVAASSASVGVASAGTIAEGLTTEQARSGDIAPQSLSVEVSPEAPRIAGLLPQRLRVMVGNVDLNTASYEQIRAILPARYVNARAIGELIRMRDRDPLFSIADLAKVPGFGAGTIARIQQVAQGSDIFIFLDPQFVKTPAQLWASNLGLTKPQARRVFQELQLRGAFTSIEDIRLRLKGAGIGEKTLENMLRRSTLLQRQKLDLIELRRAQLPVSVGSAAPLPRPRPRGYTISPNAIAAPRIPKPAREIAEANLAQAEEYLNKVSELQEKVAQSRIKYAQISRNQRLASLLSEYEQIARRYGVELSDVANDTQADLARLDKLAQEVEGLHEDFQELLDPDLPNFYQTNQTRLYQIRKNLEAIASKNLNLDSKALERLEEKYEAFLESMGTNRQIIDFDASIESLSQEIAALSADRSRLNDPSLVAPSAIADLYSGLPNQIGVEIAATVEDYRDSIFRLKRNLNDIIAEKPKKARVKQVLDRLNQIPFTIEDLPPELREKYQKSVRIRQLRPDFRKYNSFYDASVENQIKLAETFAQGAREDLEGYGKVKDNWIAELNEQAPILSQRIEGLTQEILNLPKGQASRLYEYRHWNPLDRTTQRASNVSRQFKDAANAFEQAVGQIWTDTSRLAKLGEFKYKYKTYQELVDAYQKRMDYLNDLAQQLTDLEATGSSSNRIKGLIPKLNAKDPKAIASLNAKDAIAFSIETQKALLEMESLYIELGAENIPNLNSIFPQIQAIKEQLAAKIGNDKIKLYRAIDSAKEETENFLTLLRSNPPSLQTALIGEEGATLNQLIEKAGANKVKVSDVLTIKEPTAAIPVPVEKDNVPRVATLASSRQKLEAKLLELESEYRAAEEELLDPDTGKVREDLTKRRTTQLNKKLERIDRDYINRSQEIAQINQDIGDLLLSNADRDRVISLRSQKSELNAANKQDRARLTEINQSLNSLQEQFNPEDLYTRRNQKARAAISGLSAEKESLLQRLRDRAISLNQLSEEIRAIQFETDYRWEEGEDAVRALGLRKLGAGT